MLKNLSKNLSKHAFSQCFSLLLVFFMSFELLAQSAADLSDDFLESLPPELLDDLDVNNDDALVNEKLLRYDTSIEDKNLILQDIQKKLNDLEQRILQEEGLDNQSLEIFGQSFFSSIQTTFSPFDLANISDSYILGPGDVLEVSIISSTESDIHMLTVNQKGSIIIPNVGEVNLSNFNVGEASKVLQTYVGSKLIGAEVFIAVKEMKDVQIVIMGYVNNPGIYTIAGNSSYLHALDMAGGISDSGSYRNIDLLRNGEIINNYDLYQTFSFGKINNLTTLRSGDVLFVRPKNFTVAITGGINKSAIYEILDKENLSDLIAFAGNFSENSYGFDNLILKRINNETTRVIRVPLESIDSVKLFPRDSIVVPYLKTNPEVLKTVKLSGEVINPGEYFLNDGETLSNLIKRAGGYDKNAYHFGSALFRESVLRSEIEFAEKNYEDTINYIVSNIGTPNTSIDANAVTLLSEELKSQKYSGRVVTEFNLSKLSRDPSIDLILQDGDSIVVPPLSNIVYLFGEFHSSTSLVYDPDLRIGDYIKLTGGVKDTALDELLIIDPDGKTHIYKNRLLFDTDITIYPGSIIYAPRNIGQIKGINYAATVSPILSSLALTLASLNSISD